ncbi:hypothetical protein GINT2_000948 [Glugoides intestinalis]
MAQMRKDVVDGKLLKTGAIFSLMEDKFSFYKVTDTQHAKPGKHGSAKNIVSAKNILNGKSYQNTFLDGDKVLVITDFGYIHKVVYDKINDEIVTNLNLGESIFIQSFLPDDKEKIETEFKKYAVKNNNYALKSEDGSVLVIKYTDLDDENHTLIFWDLFYCPVQDLQRHGITDYEP